MLEFIFIPVVFGIVTLGIYRIVELFVRKKERLLMVEKLGLSEESAGFLRQFPFPENHKKSYGALKAACLLIGLGVGLLAGFLISSHWQANLSIDEIYYSNHYEIRQTVSVIYGASVLLSGGLGLLLSFFLEQKFIKKGGEEPGPQK